MMRNINYYILLFGFALFIQSCDKKRDAVFEEGLTVRLDSRISENYSILRGNSAGWIMKYYPSSNQGFGGYSIFVKFTSADNVNLQGDFDLVNLQSAYISSDPNSSYEIYAGPGPILTFNTYNSTIHYFSLPGQVFRPSNQIGLIDGGYAGDFEFLINKATVDSVIMEGRKSYNRIVMTPISVSEESTIVNAYKAATTKFHKFGGYKFEIGTETLSATFVNTVTKRALRASESSSVYSYRYTPSGLDFYKEYELKGVKFKELKYVEPTGTYAKGYFTNEAGTIKLVPTT